MVISDLNIICMGQKKPELYLPSHMSFDIIDKNKGGYSNWKRLQRIAGVWYSIYPAARNRTSPPYYDDEFFDLQYDDKTRTCFVVELSSSAAEIERLVAHCLELSPDNALRVLIRLDIVEHKREFCCTVADFIDMLRNREVRFDYIYRVFKERIRGKRTKNVRLRRKRNN